MLRRVVLPLLFLEIASCSWLGEEEADNKEQGPPDSYFKSSHNSYSSYTSSSSSQASSVSDGKGSGNGKGPEEAAPDLSFAPFFQMLSSHLGPVDITVDLLGQKAIALNADAPVVLSAESAKTEVSANLQTAAAAAAGPAAGPAASSASGPAASSAASSGAGSAASSAAGSAAGSGASSAAGSAAGSEASSAGGFGLTGQPSPSDPAGLLEFQAETETDDTIKPAKRMTKSTAGAVSGSGSGAAKSAAASSGSAAASSVAASSDSSDGSSSSSSSSVKKPPADKLDKAADLEHRLEESMSATYARVPKETGATKLQLLEATFSPFKRMVKTWDGAGRLTIDLKKYKVKGSDVAVAEEAKAKLMASEEDEGIDASVTAHV